MPSIAEIRGALAVGHYDRSLAALYDDVPAAKDRVESLCRRFEECFGQEGDIALFSAPGRVEIGGNHTDHNNGRVLCAAVDLDALALARRDEGVCARLYSKDFLPNEPDLSVLEPQAGEHPSSALIRGVCAAFTQAGGRCGGFSAVTESRVQSGSGLSSSAAFENLVALIVNDLYNDGRFRPIDIAKFGKYAENVYMGKPSGMMDQCVSAHGGLCVIDFYHAEEPVLRRIDYDFAASGYAMCVTAGLGSHAGLTEAYAAIPADMHRVAKILDGDSLRRVPPQQFYERLSVLRTVLSERALLRAHHFFAENERVEAEADALEKNDVPAFLRLVRLSGASSYQYLQNVVTEERQDLGLALALGEHLLGGEGAVRVHGGGFAGTILAFVPLERLEHYKKGMEAIYGTDCCRVLRVRKEGAMKIRAADSQRGSK